MITNLGHTDMTVNIQNLDPPFNGVHYILKIGIATEPEPEPEVIGYYLIMENNKIVGRVNATEEKVHEMFSDREILEVNKKDFYKIRGGR